MGWSTKKSQLMVEEEPEPGPREEAKQVSYAALFDARISRCLKAYYQFLQLATEVASVSCYFSQCAPYFLQLAEWSKLQAGVLMDLVISQGGSVKLPPLESPCLNLSVDKEEGEQTLTAALEACLQLESSKNFGAFHSDIGTMKNAKAQRAVEEMTIFSARKQEELARLVSTLFHSNSKLEALAHMRATMGG
jgi:hypothetical protein